MPTFVDRKRRNPRAHHAEQRRRDEQRHRPMRVTLQASSLVGPERMAVAGTSDSAVHDSGNHFNTHPEGHHAEGERHVEPVVERLGDQLAQCLDQPEQREHSPAAARSGSRSAPSPCRWRPRPTRGSRPARPPGRGLPPCGSAPSGPWYWRELTPAGLPYLDGRRDGQQDARGQRGARRQADDTGQHPPAPASRRRLDRRQQDERRLGTAGRG